MQKIATVTVGAGGAASIDFTSIPNTFTDLVIVCSARTAYSGGTNDTVYAQLNGDTTAANYTYMRLIGNGGSATTASGNTFFFVGYASSNADTANTFGSAQLTIPNYAGTGAKVGSAESAGENNATTAVQGLHALRWSGTAAITSIKIQAASATNLLQYSTATLYGITKGTGGATAA